MATLLGIVALVTACAAEADVPPDSQTETASFSTIDRASGTTLIAIVGDAGEREESTLGVAALVGAARPDAVFTAGDNEYTTEGRTTDAYEESVGGVYGDWVSSSKFFPVPGDHDYGDSCGDLSQPADLGPYLDYFELPVGPEDETYYQVTVGDIDVFAIDSLADCHRDGGAKLERQRRWLSDVVPQSDALMQVVVLHNPPYSSGISHGSVEELRWEFATWGVDLVVAGDDHIYERSTHDGVTYLVNGLGGVAAHELGDPIEGSEVLYAAEFGATFVLVEPSSGTATVAFQTVTNEIIDEVVLSIGTAPSTSTAPAASDVAASPLPPAGASWHWQLQGDLNTTYDVDVYDIDLFDVSAAQIAELRRDGRYVVCYFSAGSYEDWRDDAADFPADALGNALDDWEGERWLDIRDPRVFAVLAERIELAAAKGCDGVEPDNITAINNDTGFAISSADQLNFNRSLADAAHQLGLTIALKNGLEQIPELVDWFDFAVNEQCMEFDECGVYRPFIDVGKPVFNAEYAAEFVNDPATACERAAGLGLSTVILSVELDDSLRISC